MSSPPQHVVNIITQISKYDQLYIKYTSQMPMPFMAKHCIKIKNELLEQLTKTL